MELNRALQPMDPNLGKRKSDGDEEWQAKRMRAQDVSNPFHVQLAQQHELAQHRELQRHFTASFGLPPTTALYYHSAAQNPNPIIRHAIPSFISIPTDAPVPAHRSHQPTPKRVDSGVSHHFGYNFEVPGPVIQRQPTLHTQATFQAGTQADPISLDENPVSELHAFSSRQDAAAPIEQKWYAVARGLLVGVFELDKKEDVKKSTIGWPGARWRLLRNRDEAEEYVRNTKLPSNDQRDVVRDFFGAFQFTTRAEWTRRKDLYAWFINHPRTQHLLWKPDIRAPRDNPFLADDQKAGKVAGSEVHDPNSRLEQYHSAPAFSTCDIPSKIQNAPPPSHYRAPMHTSAANARKTPAGDITKKKANVEQRSMNLQNAMHQYEQVVRAEEERLDYRTPTQQFDSLATHMGIVQTPVTNAQPPAEAKVEPDLCPEQRDLVNLILSGRNVFYTGSAGCGKSTVLKAFVKALKAQGLEVRIVAPTGKAALEVNGTTYFTFAGWVPSHFKKPLKELRRGAHQTWVNKRMRSVDVLIIDEISMLENHIFERLNEVMKEARGSNQAFGGVQIVVTGDFCQLPPVKPFKHCLECGREMMHRHYNDSFECRTHGSFPETDKWAFKSKAWAECDFHHVNLTTIHRQRDRAFIDILERCRMGKQLTNKETGLLLNHKCNVKNPTRLYSTRAEVNRLNEGEYAKLKTEARQYKAFDDATIQPHHPNLQMKAAKGPDGLIAALRESKFEPQVDMKEGMRVVLQVNMSIDLGLVNGAQGVIVGWEAYDKDKLPRTEKKNGSGNRDKDPTAAMTMAANIIAGEHAQYREAKLKDFVKYRKIKEWPIVEFDNGLQRTIYAECLVYEFGDDPPYSIMSRTQVPLIAGWAMTVHKSQGMTLNQVEVDLGKAFEEGQMYVALSRATSLEGLKVRSLGTMTGGGNAEVHEFLREKFGLDL